MSATELVKVQRLDFGGGWCVVVGFISACVAQCLIVEAVASTEFCKTSPEPP